MDDPGSSGVVEYWSSRVFLVAHNILKSGMRGNDLDFPKVCWCWLAFGKLTRNMEALVSFRGTDEVL